MYARDILSRPVVTVRPEAPLNEAIERLTEHGFAALPVVDDNDRMGGCTPNPTHSPRRPYRPPSSRR
ncbi:HPP family protein [Nocardia sp. NPDC052278]|uniref:CBS domain-containing protein n=1 Tax=unclassified Nocardia TaxID=2637762 RepID=UPI0036AAA0DA